MTEKEEQVLAAIVNYVNENNRMPTMRYLQKKLSYKSVNSITQHLKTLEELNYLKRNSEGKIILNDYATHYKQEIKAIKIVNMNNNYVHIILNKNEKHIGYQIKNNYFKDMGIFKNDILIIKIDKKLNNNDLVLFVIDNKYRIMQYHYKDGFYILNDNEEIVLSHVKIIGKVIMIEKKL